MAHPDTCPQCGGMDRCYFIQPKDGTTARATRTGSQSQRRVWACGHCRKQFSVLTDTVMHGTKISIRKWLLVIFEVCASKNSCRPWEIIAKYEVTNETAWHMLHRIREAMRRNQSPAFSVARSRSMSRGLAATRRTVTASDPREVARKPRPARCGQQVSDKQPIVSLVHYETRQVRSRVVADVTAETLMPAIAEVMDLKRTHLHTDGGAAYKRIAPHVAEHEFVDHDISEYTRGNVSTNLAEGYFSQLKRSIDGTHHHVSVEHLPRYLAQFDFMYSHCRETDSQRFRRVIGNVDGGGCRTSHSPRSKI